MEERQILNTKQELQIYLKEITAKINFIDFQQYTTIAISKQLLVSRNLTSHYLNEFFKEGKLVKINSRPAYFFDKQVLLESFKLQNIQNEFYDLQELIVLLEKELKKENVFKQLIGFNSSLKKVVEKCIAAINYPPFGSPLLLIGDYGSGCSYIAQLCYLQAKYENLISKDNLFYELDGLEINKYSHEIQCNMIKEIILKCNSNDFLYLKNFEYLSETIQTTVINEIKKNNTVDLRMVISSTKEIKILSSIKDTLIECMIPNFSSRSIQEKEHLVASFFENEEKRIKKHIKITERTLHILCTYDFKTNIQGLKECIQSICIQRYPLAKQENCLKITVFSLPDYILKNASLNHKDETRFLSINEIKNNIMFGDEKILCKNIVELANNYLKNNLSYTYFLQAAYQHINDYDDLIIFKKNQKDVKLKYIEHILIRLFDDIGDIYNINMPRNFVFFVTRWIYYHAEFSNEISHWKDAYHVTIETTLELISKKSLFEYNVMKDLVALIYNNLEVKLLPFECLLICILFTTIEYTKQKLPIFATIICHGYATASSIADVCNKMLKRHVFNAIDMPYTMSIREVCNHFKKIIYYNNDRDILLLVDLGSLENIMQYMKDIPNVNLGIINNVSTNLALAVGNEIIKENNCRDILRLVQEQTIITYKFFEKKEAKYLIIFVSEIGSDIAAQVAQLFMKSMPKVIEVEVKCFDSLAFINLYNQGEFDKNQILFIATTINLGIDFKSIIAIEDIVTFNNLDLIQEKLSSFFSNEDYQKFEKQLMKNFSLQNVVGELTILNADKALNAVGMMIDELQIQLHQTFLAKTIIGLNIHLCCLIERLIKKEEIVSHINIVDFEKNNQEFINGVRISFKAIANQYNITIPISEIAYIYDYVLNNYKTDMSIDEI